jgi:hypothetical protein
VRETWSALGSWSDQLGHFADQRNSTGNQPGRKISRAADVPDDTMSFYFGRGLATILAVAALVVVNILSN